MPTSLTRRHVLAGSSLSTHADSIPDIGPPKWSPEDVERKRRMIERARMDFIATASEFELAMVCDTSNIQNDMFQMQYVEGLEANGWRR